MTRSLQLLLLWDISSNEYVVVEDAEKWLKKSQWRKTLFLKVCTKEIISKTLKEKVEETQNYDEWKNLSNTIGWLERKIEKNHTSSPGEYVEIML